MTNAIAVLYDLTTEENREYSINIITTLASRGIAFDMSESDDSRVCLIVDGSIYDPDFIKEHQKDVLKHASRIDRMIRKREGRLVEIAQ